MARLIRMEQSKIEQWQRLMLLQSEIIMLASSVGIAPREWHMDKTYRRRIVADYLQGRTNREEIVAAFRRYAVAARDGKDVAHEDTKE